MRIKCFFICTDLSPLHPKMHCAKFGWNWLSGSWEDKFYILSIYFRYFVIISPWKRAGPTYLNKLESPSHLDALCQVWWKLGEWFWTRSFFLYRKFFFFFFFLLFRNYLSLIKGGALIWTKLNPLHSRMLCARLGWNWQSGSGEEDFFKFPQCILAFCKKEKTRKGLDSSFEQNWILFTQGCLVLSLVEIGSVVLENENVKG